MSVLVSLTALLRITRQMSISFSPSSSFSGILATASEMTLEASGSRNASMISSRTNLYMDQSLFETYLPSVLS
jgi:hypothetical protein